MDNNIQWNLRIMDKLRTSILSIVQRLSLLRRWKCTDNRQEVNSLSIVRRLSAVCSVHYRREYREGKLKIFRGFILLCGRCGGLSVYSGTSDNGLSEEWTTSLQQFAPCLPYIFTSIFTDYLITLL